MNYVRTCTTLLGAALGAGCLVAEAATLEDLVAEALENNPAALGAEARWRALAAGADAVDAWPAPTLAYGYFVEPVETRVGPQEHKVMLNQSIPWFGTPGLRRRVVEADADASYHRYTGEALRVAYEVKATVYDHAYLVEAISLTQENIDLVRHLESVAQARLRSGGQADAVVKAQLELGRLSDRLASLRDRERPLAVRLNAALGRSLDERAPWPEVVPYHKGAVDADIVSAMSLESSAELKVLEAGKARGKARVDLARRSNYPGLVVGLDYTAVGDAIDPNAPDSGKDAVMARIGISLPLWLGKNRAEVAAARDGQTAADRRFEDGLNRLRVDLEEAVFALRDARRTAVLYRETLQPQARHALQLAEEAYRAGSSGFLDLIDAQRLLLELQQNYHRARADAEIGRAKIEMITGSTPVENAKFEDRNPKTKTPTSLPPHRIYEERK